MCSEMLEKRNFYINGAWVAPSAPRDHQVIHPGTEEPCATISLGGQPDTDKAVAAAKAALPGWAARPLAERRALVERILEIYVARTENLAQATSLEMGAPIDLSRRSQVGAGVYNMRNFLAAFDTLEFERSFGGESSDTRIVLEPIGVVGLITPWNWPLNQITFKVVAALLAGCTIVLKPSEMAPLSAMVWAEVMEAAGTPPGVFNLVNGDGPGVGSQLSVHPDVQMISFTGSTRAGVAITKAAADTHKRVCLELGGKGANLIFADADDKAVQRCVAHVMMNSGQSCNAPTRMLVERPIYEMAVEAARLAAESTLVGDPMLSGPHIGPVVSLRQYDQIQGFIQSGIAQGARLVAGGPGRPEGMNRGYFVRPTVFADVAPDMTISREEIFGPVLSIIPFNTEDEALRIANDSPFGLGNYVQTADPARRRRLARSLKAGMVEMNGRPLASGSPFGGTAASGRAREGGVWGIEEFLEVKAISGW